MSMTLVPSRLNWSIWKQLVPILVRNLELISELEYLIPKNLGRKIFLPIFLINNQVKKLHHMDILGFKDFHLLLEQNEDLTAPAPPASPANDVPPASTAPIEPSPTPAPGADPSTLPPDPNAAPLAPEEPKPNKFIFIQDASGKKWHGEHDKHGGAKRFTVYEVSDEELDKWLTAHKLDADSDKVKAALIGKREMPSSVYSDFKKEVVGGELGSDKGSIDITFDSDTNFENPSTTDLDVVFLKSAK